MRRFLAALAAFTAAFVTASAGAESVPHFRASHQNGVVHFRASHGHQQSTFARSSSCARPIVTSHRHRREFGSGFVHFPRSGFVHFPRSGFVHFSEPTIVSAPGVIPSSRGWRGSCGGFYHGKVAPLHAGSLCGYNGSVGSDNATNRKIDTAKRSRVHSPKLTKSSGD